MKNLAFIFFIVITLTNCTHRVVRTGYSPDKSKYKSCDIPITKVKSFSEDQVTKLGDIRLGESGFSAKCNEDDALRILTNEGCALGADMIYISEERRMDIWSSCYRCTAEFYKYDDPGLTLSVTSDISLDTPLVEERVRNDKKTKRAIWIGTIVGTVVGVMLANL